MTQATSVPVLPLHDGRTIPQLGFGVYKLADDAAPAIVGAALAAGYRSVDTASVYANEAGIGRALRASVVSRSDLFVTTKLWNDDQGFDAALRAFDAGLRCEPRQARPRRCRPLPCALALPGARPLCRDLEGADPPA